MKKRLLFLAAMASAVGAFAQTDVTSQYLKNAGFDVESDWQTTNVAAGSSANSLTVSEWTSNGGASWCSSASFAIGSEGQINGAAIPTTNADGGTDGGVVAFSVGWGSEASYTQSVTLPAGTYNISYAAYNSDAKTQIKSVIGFYPTSGTNQVSSKTSFTKDKWETETITFELAEETSGTIKVGFKAIDGGSNNHAKVSVDYIKLTSGIDLTNWNTAKADAQALLDANPDVKGDERTALENAIKVADPTTATAMNEAIEAVNTAVTAFKAAVAQYALDQNLAAYKAVLEKYTEDVTTSIGEVSGWTQDNITTNKGQHWDGTATSTYYEQKTGWNQNSWTASAKKEVTLPAGKYALVASGRGSASATLTMAAGENSVNFTMRGDKGKGIATDGTGTYADDATYANTNGRGWEWRAVEFEVTEDAAITLAFNLSANTSQQWVSFCNVKLLQVPGEVSKTELLAAISDAQAANATVASETLTAAIAAAQEVANSSSAKQKDVDAAVETLNAAVKAAVTTAGANVTYKIINPSFEQDITKGWSQDGSIKFVRQVNTSFGKDGSQYAEYWQPNGNLNMYQAVNLPAGIYNVTVRAKARGVTSAALYVGESEKAVTIADSEADYTVAFQSTGEETPFTIGFKAEGTGVSQSWVALDNFRLTYVSTDMPEVTATEGKFNKDVKAAEEAAIAAYNADKTFAKYEAALEAISASKNSVDAYAKAKAAIENRELLLTKTNFYKADNYDAFITTPKANYEAETMTDAEANALEDPYATTKIGWHAATQLNSFFGAAWGVTNYDGTPYINTWSTEGDGDGSEFKVPFYEYWTGDADKLGDATKTGTIGGLKKNSAYDVTASVRVRISNNETAPATGITMQVGSGEAVAITGTQIGDSRLYVDNYKATGFTDADGNLTVKFNIASTNVSWLSFQHVFYTYNEEATGINTVKTSELKDAKIYNLNGQRISADKMGKGLYIINGKKVIK